jgi:hypothetical protein
MDLFLFGDDFDAVLEALEAEENIDEYFEQSSINYGITILTSSVRILLTVIQVMTSLLKPGTHIQHNHEQIVLQGWLNALFYQV